MPTTMTQAPPSLTTGAGRFAAVPRSDQHHAGAAPAGAGDAAWRGLYRLGAAAAALMAVLTVAHAGVFAVAGLPATVAEWFALFQRNGVLGLLASELLMVLYVALAIPVALALWAALGRREPALMVVFVALSLVGAAAFIAARPAFEMQALSAGYALATTDAQRALFLAAGEAALATFHGTTFWVSYALGAVGGLVLAAAMLRTAVFGKAAAYLRIASSVLDLGLFVPAVGLYLSLGSVLCLLAFNLLVARRLFQLGARSPGRGPAARHAGKGRTMRGGACDADLDEGLA